MREAASDRVVPKLADVAERAQVSTATVSRCLNTPEQVVPETRERVMKAVRELGYAPNFSARALAARQTNTVGAVIPTMDNAVFARGLQAFQEELGRHGKTLLVASSAYQQELEDEQVRALVARGADALLLIGYDRSDALYSFLEKRGVPTLVSWSFSTHEMRPAIGFDNRAAMAALARRVIEVGHRNIACISAPTAANDRARGRVQGIEDAMAEAGLAGQGPFLIETPYKIENGETAFRQVMQQVPETTAVMCINDVLAIGALRAARQSGLRVPQDISITGFDDIEIATLADPSLTTLHVPHREMGRQAATVILEMLSGESKGQRIELATDIRLRETLGPVRGGGK